MAFSWLRPSRPVRVAEDEDDPETPADRRRDTGTDDDPIDGHNEEWPGSDSLHPEYEPPIWWDPPPKNRPRPPRDRRV